MHLMWCYVLWKHMIFPRISAVVNAGGLWIFGYHFLFFVDWWLLPSLFLWFFLALELSPTVSSWQVGLSYNSCRVWGEKLLPKKSQGPSHPRQISAADCTDSLPLLASSRTADAKTCLDLSVIVVNSVRLPRFLLQHILKPLGGDFFEEQDRFIAKMRLEDPNGLNKPGLVHFMRCLSAFWLQLGQLVRHSTSPLPKCLEEECWPASFATPTRTAPVEVVWFAKMRPEDQQNVEGESKSEIKSPFVDDFLGL